MERGVLDDYTRLAEVVTLSDEMMVDSLKSLCESHMLSSLCPTNALVFWEIACAHGLARCESEAGKHIDHAAEQLLSSQWILSASEDTMRNILSRDGLHTSERNVFEAVVRWGSRQQSEKPLRERIRYAALAACAHSPLLHCLCTRASAGSSRALCGFPS